MFRIHLFAGLIASLLLAGVSAQDTKKDAPKKMPILEELVKLTPEQFIKRFDKNGDGLLTKDELPMYLGKAFDAADKNKAGKLDRSGAAAMQAVLKNFLAAGGQPKKTPPAQELDKIVNDLLKQFDTDGDGKISRKEARGRILEIFDQLDTNKDGYLDRKELLVLAERRLANQKGFAPKGGAAYDFDALDKNADGRLSKDELKGTPLYARFAEIDTDQSGTIDRAEFEAFLERENAKKK